jgi:hypothetical protein
MMKTILKNNIFTCSSCFRTFVLKNNVCFDSETDALLCHICCEFFNLMKDEEN